MCAIIILKFLPAMMPPPHSVTLRYPRGSRVLQPPVVGILDEAEIEWLPGMTTSNTSLVSSHNTMHTMHRYLLITRTCIECFTAKKES